ncbi:MAG: murein biosynthesis integral membrane protein MurJ [Verrucomicrobiota bacterium]|nr:murein biosynthesis integral membrane protein MurJ [Verrucomicrobiota bacterium]
MLKSTGAMGAATLFSRILGMVREMVYARFMGDGYVASAFFYAFQIPNLFRRLLGEGALTAAFIPLFKEKEMQADEKAMWHVANTTISFLITVCSVAITLIILFATAMIKGVSLNLETLLFFKLLRIMSPYVMMVCVAAVMMGILNARGFFFIPALGASTLNIVMIASVYLIAPRFGSDLPDQARGLAVGILLAGVTQTLFQFPLLFKEGYRFHWVHPWKDATVKKLISRILPGVIGVAAFQVNIVLTNAIAFTEGKSIVASFNYATRIMELPQGIFGVSLATFLLPMLSGLAAEKKYGQFQGTLRQGMSYLIYANWMATVLIFVMAEPIIRLLFEGDQFGPDATQRASMALKCLIPGLVSFSLVNVLARAFFALGDIKTPMFISIFSLASNLIFAIFLIPTFQQAGMGVANSLSSFVNLGLLWYAIRRKFPNMKVQEMRVPTWTVLGVGLLTGVLTWLTLQAVIGVIGHRNLLSNLAEVFIPLVLGTCFYGLATYWSGVPTARELVTLLQQKLDRH